MVDIPLDQLTNRQVHLHLIGLYESQHILLTRIEKFMADLTTSVGELQAAVDSVAVRFAAQLVPLSEALAAAQALAASEQLQDDATKAELAAALQAAVDAAAAIDAEVAELNGIGAEPDVPVEVVPIEELPPPPSEETPPEQ